jgi:hypothetical protein
MSMQQQENGWGTVLGLARDFGLPLADKFGLGLGSQPNKKESVEERISYNKLNGSGANDAGQSRKAPTSTNELLFGKQTGEAVAQKPLVNQTMLLAVLVAVVAWLALRR